ncbi:MAG: alanine racemase [Leptospirales bacterium]|nr:alanine racemase [Leptospirales bacterium]
MIKYSNSPIYSEIDLNAFRHNLDAIKKILNPGANIMAIVKADAYSHGAETIAREALSMGATILAVARMNEAIELRDCGIDAPILLLLADSADENIPKYFELNIRPTVITFSDAEKLSLKAASYNKKLKVHVKADTGMGRLGFLADGLTKEQEYFPLANEIKRISELPFIEIEGVFSHFANADAKDKSHATEQLNLFLKLKYEVQSVLSYKVLFHMANSAGIIDIPDSHLDIVRPGIIMYGYYPSDYVEKSKIDLKPVLSLKTKIIHLKHVGPGFKVSYGSDFITKKDTKVATVPAGYADGLNRLLSSKGEMLVRGKRVPILGRVCMDLTMLDVTDIDGVSIDDEVVIIGKQGDESISANEIAEKTGTINYEVLTSIGSRVPKKFINV